MVARSSVQQLKQQQTETEIAVLHIQFSNLAEKVDDLKTGLKEVNESVKANTTATMSALKEIADGSSTAHKKLEDKISSLEKWRWMIMGGVALAGGIGFHVVGKLFGL